MNRNEKTASVLFQAWKAKIKVCTQTYTYTVHTQFFLVMRVVLQLRNGTNVKCPQMVLRKSRELCGQGDQ